jgi:hypothetical protein
MWNVSLIDRQPMFALRHLIALVSLSLSLARSLSLACSLLVSLYPDFIEFPGSPLTTPTLH